LGSVIGTIPISSCTSVITFCDGCASYRLPELRRYFYHLKPMDPNPQANDPALQDRLIAICAEISGVALPA
jgi:hypothetical protein